MENIPKIDPKYLTKNKLWDSYWLEKKYPEKFKRHEKKKS